MTPDDWLLLCRSVRFGDTDAAGVMHFPRLFSWCHEAYEESLERFGLTAAEIFPRPEHSPAVALPVVHCSADYQRPLACGDALTIALRPERIDPGCFALHYRFSRSGEPVAQALTRHLAIDSLSRRRCALPAGIQRWLEASGLGRGVTPLP